MELKPLGIEGAWLAVSPVWIDERGFFREWFKLQDISRVTGRDFSVAQANISSSSRGVVRGIHYSLAEGGQAKWVTCVSGKILDVVVDIRQSSPTFGRWISIELSYADGKAIYLEEGLGHGFASLEDKSTVAYLVSTPFDKENEFAINPLDSDLKIDWGFQKDEINLSKNDQFAPALAVRRIDGKLP